MKSLLQCLRVGQTLSPAQPPGAASSSSSLWKGWALEGNTLVGPSFLISEKQPRSLEGRWGDYLDEGLDTALRNPGFTTWSNMTRMWKSFLSSQSKAEFYFRRQYWQVMEAAELSLFSMVWERYSLIIVFCSRAESGMLVLQCFQLTLSQLETTILCSSMSPQHNLTNINCQHLIKWDL